MNIYDFDGTIYDGDSCRDIVFYGMIKCPILTIKSLRKAGKLDKEYKKGKIPFERVKEAMLSFIFEYRNTKGFINSFVKKHMKNIKPWYLSRKRENDIILSASYEIWIKEFASILGVKYVIATKTDNKGNIIGNNCKRQEKISRLKEVLPNAKIKAAYSDSEADLPMFEIAEVAFVVDGDQIIPYKKGYHFKNRR